MSACSLFDNTQIEHQRAEIARLRQEAEQLKGEADALQQQRQKEGQEREACNRAFYAFDAARKAKAIFDQDAKAAIQPARV